MLNSTNDRRPMGRVAMAAVASILVCASLSLAALRSSAPIPVVVAAVAVTPPPVLELPSLAVAQVAPSPEAAAPARGQQPQWPPATAPSTKYTGELISLDLKNVDIKDFLLLMGDISGLSVVMDRDVTGVITVSVKAVPWDQVLDTVANSNQLGLDLQGKVLRVSSKPRTVPQGRIVLDFEVLRNGKLLGQARIATADKVTAVLNQADCCRITVTPTQVAANRVELDFENSVLGETFAGKSFVVSKEMPGKILWEAGGNTIEVRVKLAAAP